MHELFPSFEYVIITQDFDTMQIRMFHAILTHRVFVATGVDENGERNHTALRPTPLIAWSTQIDTTGGRCASVSRRTLLVLSHAQTLRTC